MWRRRRRMASCQNHKRCGELAVVCFAVCEISGRVSTTSRNHPIIRTAGRVPKIQAMKNMAGTTGLETRGLCRDSLGTSVVSATYILSGGCQSLEGVAESVSGGQVCGFRTD